MQGKLFVTNVNVAQQWPTVSKNRPFFVASAILFIIEINFSPRMLDSN